MKSRDSLLFWILGLVWGTSFFWIKIAVQDVSPGVLVAFRALIAALGLIPVFLLNKKITLQWDDIKKHLWDFAFMGFFNIAFPFIMIAWAEKHIDSGLTSIINSSTPLSTIIISSFFVKDDRITISKVLGLLTGFSGVILLMSPNIRNGWNQDLIAQGAILLATISYSVSAVFARKRTQDLGPQVQAFMQLIMGALMMWVFVFATENPVGLPQKPITWLAFVWLGLLGSSMAYILYFTLLPKIGPTRMTMVTYIPPLVAVTLGVVFLGEAFYWQSIVGAILVLIGITIVNQRILFQSKQDN
jgi:drug/metabolite transporter (DMT)-like permease